MAEDAFEQASAHFEAGNFRESRQTAIDALARRPDDVALLRLVGRASLELGADGADSYFRRITSLQPDDPQAWHDLGDALVYQGRLAEATAAFREAVRLRPSDAAALIDLAHSAYQSGHVDEGISCLEQAADHEPDNVAALRSLVAMYRREGRLEEALATATRIAEGHPDDVLALLDVADLGLTLGHLDESASALRRLRDTDLEQEHEVFAYHGLIEVEMRREDWRRALELAIEATRVDRYGRTTELLAFVVGQVFGARDRPGPSRAEAEAAVAASRAEHRRLHAEEAV